MIQKRIKWYVFLLNQTTKPSRSIKEELYERCDTDSPSCLRHLLGRTALLESCPEQPDLLPRDVRGWQLQPI
jgi:hypothetical protein